jgi:hypothetical protein
VIGEHAMRGLDLDIMDAVSREASARRFRGP